MSEKPEEELDLEKIGIYDTENLIKILKQSFKDYDGQICYTNGKILKIKDFIDLTRLAHSIQCEIQCACAREISFSLKKPTTTS